VLFDLHFAQSGDPIYLGGAIKCADLALQRTNHYRTHVAHRSLRRQPKSVKTRTDLLRILPQSDGVHVRPIVSQFSRDIHQVASEDRVRDLASAREILSSIVRSTHSDPGSFHPNL
jgi:hypothetical protein